MFNVEIHPNVICALNSKFLSAAITVFIDLTAKAETSDAEII